MEVGFDAPLHGLLVLTAARWFFLLGDEHPPHDLAPAGEDLP